MHLYNTTLCVYVCVLPEGVEGNKTEDQGGAGQVWGVVFLFLLVLRHQDTMSKQRKTKKNKRRRAAVVWESVQDI